MFGGASGVDGAGEVGRPRRTVGDDVGRGARTAHLMVGWRCCMVGR